MASSDGVVTNQFKVGDKVTVGLDVDVIRVMQEGHGGWNPKMAEVLVFCVLFQIFRISCRLFFMFSVYIFFRALYSDEFQCLKIQSFK